MQERIRQCMVELFETGAIVHMHGDGTLFGVEWPEDSNHYFLSTRQLLHLQGAGSLNLEGVRMLSLSEQITVKGNISIDGEARQVLNARFDQKNVTAQRDCLLNEISFLRVVGQ